MRINPNTVHKAIAVLVAEGLLVIEPGLGTRIGKSSATQGERGELLGQEIEPLVVEAKTLRFPLTELQNTVAIYWKRLS